jgi:hypothetical protein
VTGVPRNKLKISVHRLMQVKGEWQISRKGKIKEDYSSVEKKDDKIEHHDKLSISFSPVHIIAFLFFIGLAFFLIIYGWIPSKASLSQEKAIVEKVEKKANTRYEAIIKTNTGISLTCTGKLSLHTWANTCPISRLIEIEGSEVTVFHDGKKPYEIVSDDDVVLTYRKFRESQLITILFVVFSVACAFVSILKRGK